MTTHHCGTHCEHQVPLGGLVPHWSSRHEQNFDHVKVVHIVISRTYEYVTLHGKGKSK